MATQRAGWSALMLNDLRRVYLETGKERPLEYPYVLNVVDMETNPVRDRQATGLGAMPRKPEGTGFVRDEPLLGPAKEYEAEIFGLSVEFSWELWRDELYGIMRTMAKELGRSSRFRQEVEGWSIFNNAFDNNFPGFDAVSLCHIAHPGLDGVTRGNRPSPDVGLSQTAIQTAILAFENNTNERGLPILHNPSQLVINAANKFVAREVVGSPNKAYTADNEINALNQDDLSWMVSHYLTSLTAWFLTSTKDSHDLQFMWRDRPIFDNWDDPDTKNAIFSVYQRHTKGFSSWRGVYGSTG
jgi:hypothetical protein